MHSFSELQELPDLPDLIDLPDLDENPTPLIFESETPSFPRTKNPACQPSLPALIVRQGSRVQNETTPSRTLSEARQSFFSSSSKDSLPLNPPSSLKTVEPGLLTQHFPSTFENRPMTPASPLVDNALTRPHPGSREQKTHFSPLSTLSSSHHSNHTPQASLAEPLQAAPQHLQNTSKKRKQPEPEPLPTISSKILARRQIKCGREKQRRGDLKTLLNDIQVFLLKEDLIGKEKITRYDTIFTLFKQARRSTKEAARLKHILAQQHSLLLEGQEEQKPQKKGHSY